MTEIKNTTEITKLQKRINILIWCLVVVVLVGISINWYALIVSMKIKSNFKNEKTKTYNSIHGLEEIKKP